MFKILYKKSSKDQFYAILVINIGDLACHTFRESSTVFAEELSSED